jgi:DNA-binding NarL/FixJ family response regulator
MPITVLVADDHELVRSGIRVLLRQFATDIELIGETDSFAQTIQLAEQLKPQVIVMDVHMKDIEPFDIKTRLESCGSCLVAMSMWTDEGTMETAKKFGAFKLLDKMTLSHDLIPTIRECTSPG